jgi:hypothetical protein
LHCHFEFTFVALCLAHFVVGHCSRADDASTEYRRASFRHV